MPRKRQTTVGRLNPDVRSKKDIAGFESLLGKGPLTIVLVYADWCGHCQTFKQNMWNEVSQMPEKTVNTASVHYDMVENTSLKNAKIDGYPSLLLVGTDKKPATFKSEEGATNAMPAPTSVEELKSMVNTPVSNTVSNANTMAQKVLSNAKSTNTVNTSINTLNDMVDTNTVELTRSSNSNSRTVNSYKPSNADDIPVPNTAEDLSMKPALQQMETQQQKGGQRQTGGNSLLATLTKITAEAGHVGTLLVAASEYPSLLKKLTRRRKRKSKKTMRKQRK